MFTLPLTTLIAGSIVLVNLYMCLHPRLSSSDSEQIEPGAKQQAAATEGASEQAQHGSDAHGQAYQRAAGTPLQEKS